MYGVVLWCSEDSRKAVIWCEDHGDLAYFQVPNGLIRLEAGDLVHFRSEQTRRMRLAKDLELVDQHRYRALPERLKSVGAPSGECTEEGANVVTLPVTRRSLAKPLPAKAAGAAAAR